MIVSIAFAVLFFMFQAFILSAIIAIIRWHDAWLFNVFLTKKHQLQLGAGKEQKVTKEIKFYRTKGKHGYMSNFSRHPIIDGDKYYLTSEHFYQSYKFKGKKDEEEIRCATTPGEAAKLGRDRTRPMRKDWEDIKDDVMRCALMFKFMQNPEIRKKLLATGDSLLIEDSSTDYYWGSGEEGTGKNKLGLLLMEVRTVLRARAELVNTFDLEETTHDENANAPVLEYFDKTGLV